MSLTRDAIQELQRLALAAAEPTAVPAVAPGEPDPIVVVDEGGFQKVHTLPRLQYPVRIDQHVALHDVKSFTDYLARFGTSDTAIFFSETDKRFLAVLDYHSNPGAARWCEHQAEFTVRTTPEWDAWMGSNRKTFGQVEFATFVEDNLPDIVNPAGAELLEITRTLEAKKDVTYSSALRLNNGSFRVNFDEVIKGTANTQGGSIEIPEQFTLQFAVVKGGSVFQFPARFKYRLKDRALYLWYEIIRPYKVIEQALNEAIAQIEESTHITIRKGVPALSD